MPRRGNRTVRSVALGACLLAAGALGLGACSSSDGDAEPSPTASASESPAPPPSVEEGQKDALPVLAEGWAGIREDVTVEACPIEAGEVTANGTVTNTADEARDILITVAWNAPETTDPTMFLVWTANEVPGGKTLEWSVSGDLPADAGRCVIGAKAGTITSS